MLDKKQAKSQKTFQIKFIKLALKIGYKSSLFLKKRQIKRDKMK